MKATTREDLNLKEDETMCEKCVHEDICRREQCGEPFCVIRSCFDFEEKRLRGEWIEVPKYKGYFVCSNCLKRLDGNFERFEHWEMKRENFCPVCGSDNRGAKK